MPRQIVYYYNSKIGPEEPLVDMDDSEPIPERDATVIRENKPWKVVAVMTEQSISKSGPIDVVKIYLADGQ
jgi:hypothetical protein